MSERKMVNAKVEIGVGGEKLKLKLVVPAEEIPPEAMLPGLHQLTNQVVGSVERKVDRIDGVEISCKKGCGACCRQLVPISPPEARLIHLLVESLPREARITMKRRFKEAALRLQDSGMLDKTMNYSTLTEEETLDLIREYFRLGIACPFLEDESCSIHSHRPLICREYLVISPARHCADLDQNKIQRLDIPVSIAENFGAMDGVGKEGFDRYLPLIMALEWVERFPDDVPFRPGPEWVKEFFEGMSKANIPDPD